MNVMMWRTDLWWLEHCAAALSCELWVALTKNAKDAVCMQQRTSKHEAMSA
jgi:hypothetical protein